MGRGGFRRRRHDRRLVDTELQRSVGWGWSRRSLRPGLRAASSRHRHAGEPAAGRQPGAALHQHRPGVLMRRRATFVLILAIMLGLVSTLIRYGPSTRPGLALVTRLVSGVEIGDVGRLRIEGLQGDPWSNFSLARLEIADRQGVWLAA